MLIFICVVSFVSVYFSLFMVLCFLCLLLMFLFVLFYIDSLSVYFSSPLFLDYIVVFLLYHNDLAVSVYVSRLIVLCLYCTFNFSISLSSAYVSCCCFLLALAYVSLSGLS